MLLKVLVSLSIAALFLTTVDADLFSRREKRQTMGGSGNCPGGGGCSCTCNCGGSNGGNNGGNCPPCPPTMQPPTMMPTMMPTTMTTGNGGMGNMTTNNPTGPPPTGAPNQMDCFTRIRAAQNLDLGSLVGLLLNTLLGNLVMPILQIVLTGNNTLEGAVIPLANILCFVLGIVLLVLRSIGALGLLGMNGLLQNILGGLG